MTRLVQLQHPTHGRAVALVDEPNLVMLDGFDSVVALARHALTNGVRLAAAAQQACGSKQLAYDTVYDGGDAWALLPCVDHPTEPARCHVAGTGLTHKASALNRQAMHDASGQKHDEPVTDSMRMFRWGLEGGRPKPGDIGVQPEWFYKGTGQILRGHGQPLIVPDFADDGGEEPEGAGLYLIDDDGNPRRLGLATGNEFADHVMERKNYLYLAPSKLRTGAIGPELIIEPDFHDVSGQVRIVRGGRDVWTKAIKTGEANMSHTLANMEYHQFKYPQHRRPGDVHVHYFGADAFSFGEGVALADGDVMEVSWQGFGRPLRNPVRIDRGTARYVEVKPV